MIILVANNFQFIMELLNAVKSTLLMQKCAKHNKVIKDGFQEIQEKCRIIIIMIFKVVYE